MTPLLVSWCLDVFLIPAGGKPKWRQCLETSEIIKEGVIASDEHAKHGRHESWQTYGSRSTCMPIRWPTPNLQLLLCLLLCLYGASTYKTEAR